MAVSKKTRFEVFKRDGFRCQYCGQTPPSVVLECDHIEAVASGGGDDEDNLLTSCFDCNRGKSDRPLTAIPESLTQKAARKREAKEQLEAYSELVADIRAQREEKVERLGSYWFELMDQPGYVFGNKRQVSIRQFLEHLTEHDIQDAIDIAMARKRPSGDYDEGTFRYFCGVCWMKIRGGRS